MSITNESYLEAVKFLLNYSGLKGFQANLSTYFHQGDYQLTLTKNIQVDKYDDDLQSQMSKFSEEVIDNIENSKLVKDILDKQSLEFKKIKEENQLLKEQVNQLISALSSVGNDEE